MENFAQGWCVGFAEGMALHQRLWNKLLNDFQWQQVLTAILILADASTLVEDPTPQLAATPALVGMLPETVALIFSYWADARPTRGTA